MAWLRDHLPLDAENLAVIHGDYHGGNLMFKMVLCPGFWIGLFVFLTPLLILPTQ